MISDAPPVAPSHCRTIITVSDLGEGGRMRLRRRKSRAVLFVPLPSGSDTADRWRRVCAAHCLHRGYQIVTITGDPAMVQAYFDARAAEVVIAGHPDHALLLDGLHPRVETVSDPPPKHPDHRRTRRRRLLGD